MVVSLLLTGLAVQKLWNAFGCGLRGQHTSRARILLLTKVNCWVDGMSA